MSKYESRRLVDYLSHIFEAINRIFDYIDDMSYINFQDDKLVQDAVIRNIEIIGEAANNILRNHKEFADENSSMPWNEMYLMRNRVSHGYFSVDLEVVWRTIENELPDLSDEIKLLINKLQNNGE